MTEPTSKSGINPGIYGRAFGWRISKTEKDSVSDIASSFVTLSQRDWIDVMEDYVAITRKRTNNRIAMAKVQLHIAEDIMLAQGAVKHYRKKFDSLVAAEGTPQTADIVTSPSFCTTANERVYITDRTGFFVPTLG